MPALSQVKQIRVLGRGRQFTTKNGISFGNFFFFIVLFYSLCFTLEFSRKTNLLITVNSSSHKKTHSIIKAKQKLLLFQTISEKVEILRKN